MHFSASLDLIVAVVGIPRNLSNLEIDSIQLALAGDATVMLRNMFKS